MLDASSMGLTIDEPAELKEDDGFGQVVLDHDHRWHPFADSAKRLDESY